MDISKFNPLSQYFLYLLLIISILLSLGINGVGNAYLSGSWRSLLNALPLFLIAALVLSISAIILNRARKAKARLFLERIELRPLLAFYQRIAKKSLMGCVRLGYVLLFFGIFLFDYIKTLSADLQHILLGLFSTSIAVDLILLLFGFSMLLGFSSKQLAVYCLEYLAKTSDEDLRRAYGTSIMEFFSRDLVADFHELFLSHWKFAQQINLWPEFNVIFLGLLCGNEKEKENTRVFLGKLVENVNGGEGPESYRRIAELLEGFKTEMKSLGEIEDKTMLRGRSTIRRPLAKKVEGYAPWITIGLSILAIIVSILARR